MSNSLNCSSRQLLVQVSSSSNFLEIIQKMSKICWGRHFDRQNMEGRNFLFVIGALHTYITVNLKQKFDVEKLRPEKVVIKWLGSTESKLQNIDIVRFIAKDIHENVYIEALVILKIDQINLVTVLFHSIIQAKS